MVENRLALEVVGAAQSVAFHQTLFVSSILQSSFKRRPDWTRRSTTALPVEGIQIRQSDEKMYVQIRRAASKAACR